MVYLQPVPGRSHLLLQLPPLYRCGGLPPLLTVQGFSVDQRQIVSGGAIGLYLALPQESGGTTRQDTSRPDATGLIPANRMTVRSCLRRSQPNRSTVQADTQTRTVHPFPQARFATTHPR